MKCVKTDLKKEKSKLFAQKIRKVKAHVHYFLSNFYFSALQKL